jgi:hypothetical protein
MHLSSFPYAPHVLPISVFLTWSPEWYLVRSTEHKSLCYAVFSTPLLPHPSRAQISSSALYSRKPSAYIPPSMWATNFHNQYIYIYVCMNACVRACLYMSSSGVAPCLCQVVACFLPQSPVLSPRPVRVGYVLEKVALIQVLLRALRVSLVSIRILLLLFAKFD